MTPTPEQLDTTARRVTAGIWACAVITMTASVVNGTGVFAALTTGTLPALVGLLTALAVDAALVVVLTGDGRMQQLGVPTVWGRVLRVVTLGMSLGLNCGASLLGGHLFLAALHAIPPLLLCGLAEYGQEVGLKIARRRQRQEEAEAEAREAERRRRQAEVDAEDARRREVAAREAEHQRRVRREQELAEVERRKAEAARERVEAERELAEVRAGQVAAVQRAETGVADLSARREARGGKPAAKASARRPSPVRDAAIRWLRAQRRAGRDITGIGPAEVAAAIGGSRETVKKGLPEWRSAVLAVEAVAG